MQCNAAAAPTLAAIALHPSIVQGAKGAALLASSGLEIGLVAADDAAFVIRRDTTCPVVLRHAPTRRESPRRHRALPLFAKPRDAESHRLPRLQVDRFGLLAETNAGRRACR